MALADQSRRHQAAAQASTSAPGYLQVQRTLLAACMVLAPLVIGLSFVVDPTHGVPRGPSDIYTAFHAARAAQMQLFLALNTLPVFLFAPSYIGLGMVAQRRAPWLATLGMVAGLIGSLPWALFVFPEAMSVALAQRGAFTTFVAAFGVFYSSGVVTLLQLSWVIGHLLGYLLLGVALTWVAAPRRASWAGWLMVVGVPLQMIAYPTHQGVFQMAGFFLACLGSLPAAFDLLKGSDW